jgi:hypothetical protein
MRSSDGYQDQVSPICFFEIVLMIYESVALSLDGDDDRAQWRHEEHVSGGGINNEWS